MDMRDRVRERAELAVTYAVDGAYHSAARVLRELAKETEDHACRVGHLSVKFVTKGKK